jgi:hypothetical protein
MIELTSNQKECKHGFLVSMKCGFCVCEDIHGTVYSINIKGSNMAKLKAKQRNKLKKSSFGLPGARKYPINDKAHARNAKARASQMVKRGKLSASSKAKIDGKANRVLGKKRKRA